MVQVILNADDFGLTEGVCEGIVQAIHTGSLSATTAMACPPGSSERLARWAPRIAGRIGAHLQLTSGRPILPAEHIPSLVDDCGMFPSTRKGIRGPKREEILQEWMAQVESLQHLGIQPTHLDSHHHVHRLPAAFEAIVEIARIHGLPVRPVDSEMVLRLRALGVACVDRTLTGWFRGDLTVETLTTLLREETCDLPSTAIVEVMCHPGFVDQDLRQSSKYVDDRGHELSALCDVRLRETLCVAGFVLADSHVSAAAAARAHRTAKPGTESQGPSV